MTDERAHLIDHIENAVRRGLVAAGVRGPLVDIAGPVTTSVVQALANADPLSVEEVADHIDLHGGFMRVGTSSALIEERFVPAGTLIDALLLLRRREQPDDAAPLHGRQRDS